MTSPWERIAAQIADGIGAVRDSAVAIAVTDVAALEAVRAFVAEVYRRGGLPQVLLTDTAFDRAALALADDDVLGQPNPVELAAIDWADCYVAFRAMTAPRAVDVPTARRAAQRRAMGQVSARRWVATRWCIVRVPTAEWAELIGVDPNVLLDEFMNGCLTDWAAVRGPWARLAAEWETRRQVHVVAEDTDLRLSITGRRWLAFTGEANLPDGELATAPVDESACGRIRFPGPFYFADNVIRDLALEFSDGKVVAAHAAAGEDTARALLDTDDGSRRIGEFGVGLNSAMRTLTGDLFFDEKILGTVHLALGRAYPQCGGINESALHWDIVKDLRLGGSLLLDDEPVIDCGRVVGSLLTAIHPYTPRRDGTR